MATKIEHDTAGTENNTVDEMAVSESTGGAIIKVDSYKDEKHINLTWRSWMVVLYVLSCD
jgi:hypothetical protein